MDELLQRDPPVPTGPPQSRHLSAIPAFCRSEGRIPGKRCAVLAGGAEVQGEVLVQDLLLRALQVDTVNFPSFKLNILEFGCVGEIGSILRLRREALCLLPHIIKSWKLLLTSEIPKRRKKKSIPRSTSKLNKLSCPIFHVPSECS